MDPDAGVELAQERGNQAPACAWSVGSRGVGPQEPALGLRTRAEGEARPDPQQARAGREVGLTHG